MPPAGMKRPERKCLALASNRQATFSSSSLATNTPYHSRIVSAIPLANLSSDVPFVAQPERSGMILAEMADNLPQTTG